MSFFSRLFGNDNPSEQSKFETLRDDGVRAMQMRELPYAAKCFQAALGFRHDLKTVGYLAEAYLRMGNYQDAVPLLKELAGAEGDTLEVSLLLAQAYGQLKDYAEERNVTAALLAEYPDEPRALYLAAEADHGLNEDLPAVEHLGQCLALRPDYHEARYLRAHINCDTKQYAEALNDADELVKVDAENETYHTLRAQALEGLGRSDEAIEALRKAHALNPFNEETVLSLGRLLTQGSQFREALKLYSEALDLQPAWHRVCLARAAVKESLGDQAGAEADRHQAQTVREQQPEAQPDDYTDTANRMNERYRNLNPYQF